MEFAYDINTIADREEIREIAEKAIKVAVRLGRLVTGRYVFEDEEYVYGDTNIYIIYKVRAPWKIEIYERERGGMKYKIPIVGHIIGSISRGKLVYKTYLSGLEFENDVKVYFDVVEFKRGDWISYLDHLYSRIPDRRRALDEEIERIKEEIGLLDIERERIRKEIWGS